MLKNSADIKKATEERAAAGYTASVKGAWVAAIFCVLVLGLLAGNRATIRSVDPLNAPELKTLKLSLTQHPKDEGMKATIRLKDAQLRGEYLRRLAFANQGSYVLVVGVALFLIAGASAIGYKKQITLPDSKEQSSDTVRRSSNLALRAVCVFGGVTVFCFASLAVFSRGDLTNEYIKATRGYHRPASEPTESAAAPSEPAQTTPAPSVATAQPAQPAPAASSASADTKTIPPLPLPSLDFVKADNVAAKPKAPVSKPKPTTSTPKPTDATKVHPEPPKPQTVAFDENDYAPTPADWLNNWPVFRGPGVSGFIESGDYPTAWDAKSGTGILWKTAISLPGWNSPVVWGDKIFVSGADKTNREIYCLDAASGNVIWKTPFALIGKQTDVMSDTGYAPSTMAVDGKRVFAIFPNGDLACLDFDGKILWSKNLGNPDNTYGHASSLAMYRSLLMVLFDQGGGGANSGSALLALQGGTGNLVWNASRPVANSWGTPIIINTGQRVELITSANPWIISYDPMTGQELWRADEMSGDVTPSPIYSGGFVFACNQGASLAAITPGGSGNVTKTNVAWTFPDNIPDISSPSANGELIFLAGSDGMVTCIDIKSGKKVWEHQYETGFTASPVIVGGRVYLLDADGVMHIITADKAFKEEHKSAISEKAAATPAFVGGKIYIRTEKHVFCIGKK